MDWVKLTKDFGFPVALVLILLGGFSVIGSWMMDRADRADSRQQTLVDSSIRTNDALTRANDRNSEVLSKLQGAVENANSVMFKGIMENQALMQDSSKSHQIQVEQLGRVTELMETGSKLMKDVPKSREEQTQLLKQIRDAISNHAGSTTTPP